MNFFSFLFYFGFVHRNARPIEAIGSKLCLSFWFFFFVLQIDDKLYIYLEYVSGGSIYKLLQDYGLLGEIAIRSYTQQILSGLAYLHAKNTVHR